MICRVIIKQAEWQRSGVTKKQSVKEAGWQRSIVTNIRSGPIGEIFLHFQTSKQIVPSLFPWKSKGTNLALNGRVFLVSEDRLKRENGEQKKEKKVKKKKRKNINRRRRGRRRRRSNLIQRHLFCDLRGQIHRDFICWVKVFRLSRTIKLIWENQKLESD